jgi:DNA modification methylase
MAFYAILSDSRKRRHTHKAARALPAARTIWWSRSSANNRVSVEPAAALAEAIRDCSRRGEIFLDAFGRSGSKLIAAQRTGRVARLIEYDPLLWLDSLIHFG